MIHQILSWIHDLHSADGLRALIQSGGILTVTAIIFAETGLLAGFFLPGDSLLVTAGIFAATDGHGGPALFSIIHLLICLISAAIIGDQVGFFLGSKAGKLIFQKKDSFFFKKKHLHRAHAFYEKHGGRALIIARFAPILRTFVPFIAGSVEMKYRDFLRFSVIGGVLWAGSMLLLGYFLGMSPLADQLHKIIVVIVALSLLPLVFSTLKTYCTRKTVDS